MGEGEGRTQEEKTILLKKALLGVLVVLIALYVSLWIFGMLESLWAGMVSGLFLIVLIVLVLVQRYRK